jgi:hypothetical protein
MATVSCPLDGSQLDPHGRCQNCGWPDFGEAKASKSIDAKTSNSVRLQPQKSDNKTWEWEPEKSRLPGLSGSGAGSLRQTSIPNAPVVNAPVVNAPVVKRSYFELSNKQFRLRGQVEEVRRDEDKRARTHADFSQTLGMHSDTTSMKWVIRGIVWLAVLFLAWSYRAVMFQGVMPFFLLPFLIVGALGVMMGGGRGGAVDGLIGNVMKMFGQVLKLAARAINGISDMIAAAYAEARRNNANRKHAEKIFIVNTVTVRISNPDGSSFTRSVHMEGQFKGKPIKQGHDVELWGVETPAGRLDSVQGRNHTEDGPVSMGPV